MDSAPAATRVSHQEDYGKRITRWLLKQNFYNIFIGLAPCSKLLSRLLKRLVVGVAPCRADGLLKLLSNSASNQAKFVLRSEQPLLSQPGQTISGLNLRVKYYGF
ncbi:hypothetical protein P886_5012 [Alteromonadaceae bacterium 2753L.S.0a.02]|nr:hypothetical protein P886_5012 [Alteromonadaceae bacterium 2753L.S.0a.02]